MVESSVGGCRCACQEDFQDLPNQPTTGCCSPHVFTSILLGILSCVLMTGGVFLAFHKWDLMWLMVSGVGVVLIIIGTVLHCCHTLSRRRPKRSSGVCSKSCCVRPLPPEHPHHMMIHNGSLTEQLLPLSNARSVSQLSLNMLPGYFPPVVTTYGIEQHSAVVQNINRLVQQQQQPQTTGSCSPGVSSTAGKSFIVLSLPSDTSAANIQNLVATVYQLDANGNSTESPATENNASVSSPVTIIKPNSAILKNAEVQTCNAWPAIATTCTASTSNTSLSVVQCSTSETEGQIYVQSAVPCTSSCITQTDDIISDDNLIDCSTEIVTICDTPVDAGDNQSSNIGALVNIPEPSCALLDTSVPITASADSLNNSLIDIPESAPEDAISSSSNLAQVTIDSSSTGPSSYSEVLVDIPVNPNVDSNCNIQISVLEEFNTAVENTDNFATHPSSHDSLITQDIVLDLPSDVSSSGSLLQRPPVQGDMSSELLSSCSNLSATDTEIDDNELLGRSSPPPSYDDVTLENSEAVGVFGLAYGTI